MIIDDFKFRKENEIEMMDFFSKKQKIFTFKVYSLGRIFVNKEHIAKELKKSGTVLFDRGQPFLLAIPSLYLKELFSLETKIKRLLSENKSMYMESSTMRRENGQAVFTI